MRHHMNKPDFEFVRAPEDFNKYSQRDFLKYCLGATMYMPGTKDIVNNILTRKWPELTSMVMCFEDAIAEEDLPRAEENVARFLTVISDSLDKGTISLKELPLFIIRVRNTQQFTDFTEKLTLRQIKVLTGFNFPKFTSQNAPGYLKQLKHLNEKHSEIFYGMPILESREIAYKETRLEELICIKNALQPYKELILNIRVGATDISSIFGVRRGIDYTIYDILTVRDCLSDILNLLCREDEDYVISAPVWEYFLADKDMKFKETLDGDIHTSLLNRQLIINEAVDGLLREVVLDKANGFVGKTIIHPSHIKFVNAMQAVTREEFEDAVQILETSGGVIKSATANKMNEINPHRSWAKKMYTKARAYGVINNEAEYAKLFSL